MRRRQFGLLLCLGLAGMTIFLIRGGRPLGLAVITDLIRLEHPEVQWISGQELARSSAPVLLDVRTEAEFEVSHLAGARRLEPGSPIPAELLRFPRDTAIVAYCSVGRRSATLIVELQAAGFTRARNLDGSIFRWANEDRRLVQGAGTALVVHPYNRFWGALLRPERRAF